MENNTAIRLSLKDEIPYDFYSRLIGVELYFRALRRPPACPPSLCYRPTARNS